MVIWLRSPRSGVGVGQDVLRAGDVAELVALDSASEQCARQVEQLIASAEQEAAALKRAAQEEAAQMREAARAEYDAAEQLGYEAGQVRALEEAQETMLRGAVSEHELLLAMRERIADVVMRTVARVLGDADRDALFAQIAANLSRHLDEASFLAIRVAPEDVEAATRAFRSVCEEHRWPLNPTVSADPDAEAGSCVCEWDHGIVASGLPLQLNALERAIDALKMEAGQDGELEDGEGGDEDDAERYEDEDEDGGEDEDGDDDEHGEPAGHAWGTP